MSLKFRLNLMIALLLGLVMLVGAILTIRNAREDIRAEVESTAGLALHLLDAEILHYASDYAWLNGADPSRASIFRLKSLGNVRHLRIEFFDYQGRLRDSNHPEASAGKDQPPSWFVRLMDVTSGEMRETRRRLFIGGRFVGELVITPDPSYEIAEIWDDTMGMLVLVAIFFVAVNALVYWAVNRALRPVADISAALTALEQGNLNARLPVFHLTEIATIGQKFNGMAQTLQQSMERNQQLARQLVRLQEDERKNLARDLHDEIGQSLTAIHADASAIAARETHPATLDSAQAIVRVARGVMDMVHQMLDRLRPDILDKMGLNVALQDIFAAWQRRNPGIRSELQVSGELVGLDEDVAVTAYRVVQESLTNITRHAAADRVSIGVIRDEGGLAILVEDNGVGFDPVAVEGYGLAGMRERIEALGGELELDSTPGAGACITVRLPAVMKVKS
jgi:two-component system sensor histidine kinase UhpB